MIIITNVIDRAAFFTTFGGKLLRIEGNYPSNQFVVKTNRLVALYEVFGGWIPYRKFCNERRVLKRKSRKQSRLPEYFTGNKDSHFELNDLATVVGWKRNQTPKLPKSVLESA